MEPYLMDTPETQPPTLKQTLRLTEHLHRLTYTWYGSNTIQTQLCRYDYYTGVQYFSNQILLLVLILTCLVGHVVLQDIH